jgi:hypothetical protein
MCQQHTAAAVALQLQLIQHLPGPGKEHTHTHTQGVSLLEETRNFSPIPTVTAAFSSPPPPPSQPPRHTPRLPHLKSSTALLPTSHTHKHSACDCAPSQGACNAGSVRECSSCSRVHTHSLCFSIALQLTHHGQVRSILVTNDLATREAPDGDDPAHPRGTGKGEGVNGQ